MFGFSDSLIKRILFPVAYLVGQGKNLSPKKDETKKLKNSEKEHIYTHWHIINQQYHDCKFDVNFVKPTQKKIRERFNSPSFIDYRNYAVIVAKNFKPLLYLIGNGEWAYNTTCYNLRRIDELSCRYYIDHKNKKIIIQPYTIVCVDYPGTRTNTTIPIQCNKNKTEGLIAYIVALIDFIKIKVDKKMDIYAHSIGGYVLRLALENFHETKKDFPFDSLFFERSLVSIKAFAKTYRLGLIYGCLERWTSYKDVSLNALLTMISQHPKIEFKITDATNDQVMLSGIRLGEEINKITAFQSLNNLKITSGDGQIDGHNGPLTSMCEFFMESMSETEAEKIQTHADFI